MQLSKVLENVRTAETQHGSIEIGGLAVDSRKVRKGDLFVALKGGLADGHEFLAQAASAGAAAAGVEREVASPPLPAVRVPSTAEALPMAAASFHGDPTSKLSVVGITG